MSGKFERDEVNNQKVIRVFSNGRRPESVARKKKRKAIKKWRFYVEIVTEILDVDRMSNTIIPKGTREVEIDQRDKVNRSNDYFV